MAERIVFSSGNGCDGSSLDFDFLGAHSGRGGFRLGTLTFGFGLGGAQTRFLLGPLFSLFGLALLGFEACGLFLFALGLGFMQFVRGVVAAGFGARLFGDRAALDIGPLGTDLDVDRLGRARTATGAGADLDFVDRASLEGDLPRRGIVDVGSGPGLAVCPAQESEQLHLLGAADHLLRIGEFHARFAKLSKQLVDGHAQNLGELFDRDVRHLYFSAVPARNLTCRR